MAQRSSDPGPEGGGGLCESKRGGEEAGLYAGIGVNCNQTAFPTSIAAASTSLAAELGTPIDRWLFLELFLDQLARELVGDSWKDEVEEWLWRPGMPVRFLPGLSAEGGVVEGLIEGVDDEGSLLLTLPGERQARAFRPANFSLGSKRVDRVDAFLYCVVMNSSGSDRRDPRNPPQAQGREGIFQRIIAIFVGMSDPESEKKKLLRAIGKDLARSRYKFYRPKGQEALPGLAKFFYEIYKIVAPAQVLLGNAQTSGALRAFVIESFLTEDQRELSERLTEAGIIEKAKTMGLKDLQEEVKTT